MKRLTKNLTITGMAMATLILATTGWATPKGAQTFAAVPERGVTGKLIFQPVRGKADQVTLECFPAGSLYCNYFTAACTNAGGAPSTTPDGGGVSCTVNWPQKTSPD